MRPLRLPALLAACMLVLVACSGGRDGSTASESSSASGGRSRAASALNWRDCDDGECATLRVPMDPARPDGRQIRLALARVPATDPDRRIGSLVVNPGGPGAPGTDFVRVIASELPEEITDRFDIVGWDPRGTGASSPVECGTNIDYLFDVDTAPDTAEEQAALAAASQRFAESCEQGSGELLRHIASIDTVRDLDRIRAALGDEKLTYAGFSYGTYLGALYAREHPERVRALLLDGAVDPAVPAEQVSIQQAKGFDASLDAFLEDCGRREQCAFHHRGDPRAALDALRARVERDPIVGEDGRVLGPSRLDLALAAPLYAGAGGYRVLASALRKAERGDPAPLLEIFDVYVGRSADGTYSSDWPAFIAISCADGPTLEPAAAAALQDAARREAPYFGAANLGLGVPCSYWPVPPVNSVAAPITAPGVPPIVVVGTTGDPATPFAWAEGLARGLGDARLITVDGTTHTSSLDGIPCLDRAVAAYLVDLRPPRSGLRCRA